MESDGMEHSDDYDSDDCSSSSYSDETQTCGFFKWVDEESDDDSNEDYIHYNEVIHELRMRILLLEAEIKRWKLIAGLMMFLLVFNMICLAYKLGLFL